MPALNWNEIKRRAILFANNWKAFRISSFATQGRARERAEAQTFWNELFAVFGIDRRVVASFEEPVKNLAGDTNFIDLFYKGKLIAEHKSPGKPLDKAHAQAMNYIQSLHRDGRTDESPRTSSSATSAGSPSTTSKRPRRRTSSSSSTSKTCPSTSAASAS